MYKLLIWGIGERSEKFMQNGYFANNNIVGFIDSNCKIGTFYNYPVFEPKIAYKMINDIDFIIVATKYYIEIYENLIQNSVPREKIIFTDNVSEQPYINDDALVKKVSAKLYNKMKLMSLKGLVSMNESDRTDDRKIIGTHGFDDIDYMSDYFRYRTFEFIANEIIANNIEGNVAEVGVFRGVFAKLINKKFKDKKFFLFDTFEGFNEDEIQNEIMLGRCDKVFKERYKHTTEETVLNKMPYPKECTIFKGLFPDSVTEEVDNSKFVFVSLDVDLEESTYKGIQFFYPRLSQGGVLYIHDYNSSHLSGVKRAVMRYEKDNNIFLKKLPLADACGTLVVIK